jgi:nicotinate-nucleotide adenylyltransferase
MPRRVGVLGGTFDPIHLAHLVAAEAARATLGLDTVVFAPAGAPPHKPGVPISAGEHRLALVRLAIAGNDAFVAGRFDLDRPGPHYTVDLLRLVREAYGVVEPAPLWFVMGADSLEDLPTWHDPAGILRLARLAVVGRPGFAPDPATLEQVLAGVRARVDMVPMPQIGTSGTDIRRRVAAGATIRYQVPAEVEAYIGAHKLYRPGDAAESVGHD